MFKTFYMAIQIIWGINMFSYCISSKLKNKACKQAVGETTRADLYLFYFGVKHLKMFW